MTIKAPTIDAYVRGPRLFRRGVTHHANLLYGDPVILAREPNNPKDSNAVVVSDADDNPVGYIQAEKAVTLASWMDRGWLYTGRVIVPAKIIERGFNRYVQPDTLVVRCTPVMPMLKNAVKPILAYTEEGTFSDRPPSDRWRVMKPKVEDF